MRILLCHQEEKLAHQLSEAATLLVWQGTKIKELQALLVAVLRNSRNMAACWQVAQKHPQVDISEELDTLLRDLSDQVAQLEEHLV